MYISQTVSIYREWEIVLFYCLYSIANVYKLIRHNVQLIEETHLCVGKEGSHYNDHVKDM